MVRHLAAMANLALSMTGCDSTPVEPVLRYEAVAGGQWVFVVDRTTGEACEVSLTHREDYFQMHRDEAAENINPRVTWSRECEKDSNGKAAP